MIDIVSLKRKQTTTIMNNIHTYKGKSSIYMYVCLIGIWDWRETGQTLVYFCIYFCYNMHYSGHTLSYSMACLVSVCVFKRLEMF